MKCKKNKLTLAEAQGICANVIDMIDNKAICSDGKICSHSKKMIDVTSFGCDKCETFYFAKKDVKTLSDILFGGEKK